MIQKSRNISLADLYSNLQLEFISYFVRSKIYCKNFAVNYQKICRQKKEKIEKISTRNSLPSIFNNPDIKQRYLDKFFEGNNSPNFAYKDDEIRDKMERWDKFYFYSKGVSVSYKDGDDTILGVISFNDKSLSIVKVDDEFGNQKELHYNNIKRIFPEDYFDF